MLSNRLIVSENTVFTFLVRFSYNCIAFSVFCCNASSTLVCPSDITKSIVEATKTATEVAKNVDDASKGVKEIARSSNEASLGVQEISKNIQNINQAAGQAAEGANQTNNSAKEIAKLSAGVADIVSKFKI